MTVALVASLRRLVSAFANQALDFLVISRRFLYWPELTPSLAAGLDRQETKMASTRTVSSAEQQPKPQVAAPTKGRGQGRGQARDRGRGRAQPRARAAALVVEPQLEFDDEAETE
ncbi:PREDICTED: uncharacterized protein LOC109227909 [Nicotiana attenuata]|uniref:uncharacterized protein LOC109227909 n=1 Tax=Nicotiana attenuata TaxID=49451 RepID=UPI0009052B11|nr:PREDICTED: uncharacterized protein LOC109227909 [Nicotiana attenuata]